MNFPPLAILIKKIIFRKVKCLVNVSAKVHHMPIYISHLFLMPFLEVQYLVAKVNKRTFFYRPEKNRYIYFNCWNPDNRTPGYKAVNFFLKK